MHSTTRMIEDEIFEATNEAGQKVTIDMRPASLKQAQSPVELLLSAVSACAAVDVVAILKKRKKSIRELVIKTAGERRADPPRYFTAIELHFILHSPDVTEEELTKAVQLSIEKYCSVAASLKSAVTFKVEVHR